ncbi:MAG: hypothetical protein V3W07_01620 [Syntrophobacteria bacterium]
MTYCDHGYGRPSGRPRGSNPATYRLGTPGIQSRGTAGRLPGCTPISMVSPQQFMKYPV